MTKRATKPAGAPARVISYLIDLTVVSIGGAIAQLLLYSFYAALITVVVLAILISVSRAENGRTPGAFLTKTIACFADTPHTPGFRAQAMRSLIMGLLHLTAVGPVLTIALTRNGQDWVDRIVGTATLQIISKKPSPTAPVPGAAKPKIPHRVGKKRPDEAAPAEAHHQGRPIAQPTETESSWVSAPRPTKSPQPEMEPESVVSATVPKTALTDLEESVTGQRIWVTPDTGNRVPLHSVLVFGRKPTAMEGEDEVAIKVSDPGRSLSRTHAKVGLAEEGVWVQDCTSTNGTSCLLPDGNKIELSDGQRIQVPIGTIVLLGDRTLTISQG